MGYGKLLEKIIPVTYSLVPLAQVYCFFIIVVSVCALV
jgi:hypothetical protein